MYFKSLELYGFKSFAGKTKVDFEPGITAIVGPNGCGKSNIVDALKWVLGEQSAKDLRGLNMEDVIFNGTDTRDPVGFAEVSLVMSNESKFLPIEYGEVTITRRLFRSGESEYLLNKNQVRLKDIIELFMGTGVGTSAYSIIEQGKIDMIISSKPEDRRYIFEEASGIIKYKSKKREAIRKLEYTENNLLRVNDIILEVKRQIGSIERQAKKAEKYKDEFERLKTLDSKVAFVEFTGLVEEKENLEKQISDRKNNEADILKNVSDLNSQLLALKTRLAEINSKLSESQFKELNINSVIERSQDRIALDEERYKELDSLKVTLVSEQETISKSIMELEETVSSFSREIEGISSNRAQKETLLAQAEVQFKKLEEDIRHNEHGIKNGKLRLVDVLNLHSRAKNELTKLSSDIANHQARLRRLKTEEEQVKTEESQIRTQFGQLESHVRDLEGKIKDESQSKVTLEEILGKKDEEKLNVEKKTEELQTSHLSLESRLGALQDMIRRYEGFGGGPRSILIEKQENRLGIPGLFGAVAEIINVRKGYEVAVESSLGDLLQCIVVENKSAALELMNYLKQKNLGKTTIVSLDSLEEISQDQIKLNVSGAQPERLSDFIEADPKFKNLISSLFYNVYLVNDLGSFFGSNPVIDRNIKLVTRSGEVFENGFLTGGITKEDIDTGILNRKIQVREIQESLDKVKNEMSELKVREDVLTKEIDEFVEKLSGHEAALRLSELELANKKSQKDNIETSLKKIIDEIAMLDIEVKEVEEEINALGTKHLSCDEEIKKLDAEHSAIQNLVSSSQTFIETALKERELILVDTTKMRAELAAVSEQEKNYVSNLRMRSDFLANQKALLEEKKKSFNESAARQAELKNEIDSLKGAIQNSTEERSRVLASSQEVRIQKAELEGSLHQAEGDFRVKETELNNMKDALHNIYMGLQENTFKTETLKTKMNQSYRIDIDQLKPEIEEGIDWDAVNKEIEELRQKIEKMGPVNLIAIEEHQELKERYDFLTKQQEDLVTAKDSLLEAIKKINKTTRDLFMETFQQVRVEFKEYFKFLFGGGQAELVLMDEQDILECGIEIMARPPGKKLQSISLLSGGEKALCASALLFSIFKIKPSPFCILDEVDAPLDESNVGRFSKILMDFSKKSQFIVITHNKRTMSMADVMYGITMEHSGVSKVVSVKFSRDKQTPQVEKPKEEIPAAQG